VTTCCTDYCEVCGDCLDCYAEDGCNGDPDSSHVEPWPPRGPTITPEAPSAR
jgi:hypothetical protein